MISEKLRAGLKNVLYPAFLGSLLLTVNIYFAVFVHNKSDLAPNFALAMVTIPPAAYEFIKVFKGNDAGPIK